MADTNPFDQFDNNTNPFNQFDAPQQTGSTFKSGSAFEDTKNLIPDIPGLWSQFKKEWANRKNLPQMSDADMQKMMAEEHAMGSGVIDAVGALPSMVAGGVAGIASGLWNGSASEGLKTANKVAHAFTPSTFMGNEEDQNKESYKAIMAPFTALMDTLNAVPQGYGEAVNAAGFHDAAGQLTDAGKLAIMAGFGIKGAHETYKALTSKPAVKPTIADPNEEALPAPSASGANPFDQFDAGTKQRGATDRGVPGVNVGDQGELFSPEDNTPTQPIPTENQTEMFDKPTDPGTMDYTKEFPFGLEPIDKSPEPNQMGLNMEETDSPLGLAPKESLSGSELAATPGRNFFTDPNNREKLIRPEDMDNVDLHAVDNHAGKQFGDIADAYNYIRDNHLQDSYGVKNTGRDQYTIASKDLTRGDWKAQNAAKMAQEAKIASLVSRETDHSFAEEHLGDKSLMSPENGTAMAEHLANGDPHAALDIIANNHENGGYRQLATYLKNLLNGIKVKVHDEGILQMGDRQATGYYDPTTRTVGLSGIGAVSPHTVLHEMVHAVTSDFINNRPNDLRVMGLKDLFSKLNDLGMSKDFPAITNIKEFVAEAFSNPEFQDYLKDHRVNDRGVWQRFVDNVKSVLGLGNGKATDALTHAMDLSKQIMEAKDQPDALSKFKDAGLPDKLSDLMVTRVPDEKPNEVVSNENMKAFKLANFGNKFDFTPLKPEEVIPMAREAADIPKGKLETLKANLDAGGRFASLRHSNNPVVKYTFAYVDHAVKNYERWIRENITDPKAGLKTLMSKLPPEEFTALHAQLMLDEGVTERTPDQMRAQNFTEGMIEAAQRLREIDKAHFDRLNKARAEMNPPLPPMEPRMGHLAGRFLGDFHHTVFSLKHDDTGNVVRDADGKTIRDKAVMMITDGTSKGAQKLADFFAERHPEWEVEEQKYNDIRTSQNSDRFAGFMELMNFIGNKDPEVKKALDSLDVYNRRSASNYLNAQRHAKDKKAQPGGIIGSEGNKTMQSSLLGFGKLEEVDALTNAEQGFKGHLAYLDTTAKWLEMQKAMENISKVLTDKEVTKAQPNAIQWSTAYTDHALHRNQGWLTDAANSLLSEVGRTTGLGHTNMMKGVNWMSSGIMRLWMGALNVPFAIKHLVLPFQKMPAMMTYMMTHAGLDAHTMGMASLKSLGSYYQYLKDEPTSAFEKTAFDYAKTNNIFNVTLDNISGRIQASKTRQMLGKVADVDFSAPEHAIRGTSFFLYAHALHDAGMPVGSALSAAEHLSKFLYTDYASHEAPRFASKAGWIGQLATQISRYKTNEYSELGFFNRERMTEDDHSFMEKMTSNLPLMVHLGSLLAFSGVTGMMGYNAADNIYSFFRKHALNAPDNLTALLQRSKAPDLVKYGMSSLLGIDSKISEADLLPAPFPTSRTEIDMMGRAFNAARYHDLFHLQQLGLGLVPSSLRGVAENKMFTQPMETTGPHAGSSLYLNPNTGEGRVWRTPSQVAIRKFGFHTTAETNETDNNYAMQRIMQDHRDIADHIADRAKGLMASNSLSQEAAQDLARQYAAHQQAGQAPFASILQKYAIDRKTSQREQMQLKVANDNQMGNSLSVLEKNK